MTSLLIFLGGKGSKFEEKLKRGSESRDGLSVDIGGTTIFAGKGVKM